LFPQKSQCDAKSHAIPYRGEDVNPFLWGLAVNTVSYRSSRDVARFLGVDPNWLTRQLWLRRMDPLPMKSPAGAFLWTPDDIERAAVQLLGKPLAEIRGDRP
jgi:hypothetical protein